MARLEMPLESEHDRRTSGCLRRGGCRPARQSAAPMVAWLRNPELARRGQKLGELLRFETTLEPHLSEFAILVCARHWTSHHEWTAHKAIGLKAG